MPFFCSAALPFTYLQDVFGVQDPVLLSVKLDPGPEYLRRTTTSPPLASTPL